MQRYEQSDYLSAPPGPYVEESPPPVMPMSPPARARPPFYAPEERQAGRFSTRRRASTSAAAAAAAGRARIGGFPALELSESHVEQLRVMETKLLAQYLERYDAFVEVNYRTVDTGLWKLARQAHGVKAYKRRGASTSRRSSLATQRARGGLRGRAASLAAGPGDTDDPMLLVVGSIEGTLEDVLYGAVWHSRDERSTRTYYTKDGIVDASVLATLERPSSMHPFRTLAVKWSLKRSMRSAAVIKDRDFVFLGATGTIRSRTDERIGYELRHSLTIPSCPPLDGSSIVRAEIMSCSFFRQMRGSRVEVYHLASFDAGGDLLSILAWNHAIDNYIGFASIIECSYIKKLVRAVQWSSENPPAKTDDDPQAKPWDPEDRRCGVCAQPGRSLQRKCAICHVWVCSHCSIRKEIFTPLPGRPSVARCFCKTCLVKVQRDDPTEYVLRELEQFEHRTATEYAAQSPEIAVLEPRNGEMPPPPPPTPPTSEPPESVFFAIDASPSSDAALRPVGRRQQGTVPVPPGGVPPLPMQTPILHSERASQRKRFVRDAPIDDNNVRNARGSVDSTDDRGRERAAVGRSRRVSAATSSARATHASKNPRGEILLRSDASHKWRKRDDAEQQDPNTYAERASEAMRLQKTDVAAPSSVPNGNGHRRKTVLGSELGYPMPPQPQLREHQHVRGHMMPSEFAPQHRDSVEDFGRRRTLTSRDLEVPLPPSQPSENGSEAQPRPSSRRPMITSASDTDEPTSRKPKQSRARKIYAHLRGGRPRAATSSEIDEESHQRFISQYEELVPRQSSIFGGSASPEPEAQQEQPNPPPPPPPPSVQRRNGRAPAPPRPNEPPQVRLSLLERHEHEQLQREYQLLKQQQMWIDYEHEEYLRSQEAQMKERGKREYDGEQQPPNNQLDETPQDDPAHEATAREKDELAVNTLLAELCEIARMTNDYAHSASSSMLAAAASTAPREPIVRSSGSVV